MKKRGPLFASRAFRIGQPHRYFLQQPCCDDAAALLHSAFLPHAHLSHLQSAFLFSAVHPHASHLQAAFFGHCEGHCATATVATKADITAMTMNMRFILFSLSSDTPDGPIKSKASRLTIKVA